MVPMVDQFESGITRIKITKLKKKLRSKQNKLNKLVVYVLKKSY